MVKRVKFTAEDLDPNFVEAEISLMDEGIQRSSKLVNTLREFDTVKKRKREKYRRRTVDILRNLNRRMLTRSG